MAKSKLVKANEKIAEGVTEGFQKIEDGVVGGYKKIEDGVVEGFSKMTDKFVDKFLTHEGESVEDAKKRLENEQAAHEAAVKEAAAKRTAEKQAMVGTDIGRERIEASLNTVRNSIEASNNVGKH